MATTRALEAREIKAIFDGISGRHAIRNQAMLMVGIAAALRATDGQPHRRRCLEGAGGCDLRDDTR